MRNRDLLGAMLAALAASASPAQADEIRLLNGDHITGTIVSKSGGDLKVKTSYAGTLTIKWADVGSIGTTGPVRVVLTDDTSLNATVASAGDGKVTLKAGSIIQTAPIDLTKVAYINPPPEVTGKGVRLKGRINVGLNAATGNTKNRQLHIDGEMVARTQSNRYTVGGEVNRAYDNGSETANNATAYTKYDHFLTKKRYLYVNARFEHDKYQDLNLRTSIGAGLGHQFWETDTKNLSVEGGLSYVNENFYAANDDSYAAFRWGLDYDQYFFDKAFQFFHRHEGTISLQNSSDVLISAKTGVRIPLSRNLSTSAEVDVDWDNTPVAGKKKTDLTYLLNLGYSW
jgi:putative salt-induced outer membrane protein YdiY